MKYQADSIWFTPPSKERFERDMKNTAIEHSGVEYVESGADYLKVRMPVDKRTKQPAGILHGGVSVMLAETVASMAAAACVDLRKFSVVGQEINANHLRSANTGWVYATAKPFHLGRSSQVWEIRIENEAGKIVCISRMTAAVLQQPAPEHMW